MKISTFETKKGVRNKKKNSHAHVQQTRGRRNLAKASSQISERKEEEKSSMESNKSLT